MKPRIKYKKHLSDITRLKIAYSYVQHELRKLFPNLRNKEIWKMLDTEVTKWSGKNPILVPIRDFWNGVNGISTGFKLKQIVTWLTSENIKWEIRNIDIDDLYFGTNFEELQQFNYRPSVKEVENWYFDEKNKKSLLAATKAHEIRSNETYDRNGQLVIIMAKGSKKIIMDGNRRVLRALLNKKKSLKIAIGTVKKEPMLNEFWIPTPYLQDLVRTHRLTGLTKEISKVLVELLRNTSAGRIEFRHRAINENDKMDIKLLRSVEQKVKF